MKFSITEFFMMVSLTLVISFSFFSSETFGHYGEPLSGFGTAKIDGIRSVGEWDNAHVISVFGGKSDSNVLLVMNDEDHLYMGLYVIDNVLTSDDKFSIMFDNNHNGIFDVNDDSGEVSGFGSVSDGHFDGNGWVIDSRQDGKGAAQREETRNFFEYSKPLRSGDENDFNLTMGDVVGFCITYVRDGITTDSSQFGPACRLLINEQKIYGDILLVPFSITWHGLMAMDADKRNVGLGEVISYKGYLYGDHLIDNEIVYVNVYELGTGKTILKQNLIPNSDPVDYFENTAWPFTFKISTSQYDFQSGMTYVVEAKYANQATKLNFLIKSDKEENLEKKAVDAGKAIADAGKETGELVVEAGKEAGKTIVDVGGKAVEKGAIVGEKVAEKGTETGKIIAEKSVEGIEEIKEKGGGCLIATAAYGTELSSQVQLLREIRDNTVMNTESGVLFMTGFNQIYYTFSPAVADLEREQPIFRETIRLLITPMISTLFIMELAENGNEAHMLVLGGSILALNIGMYIVAPAFVSTSMLRYLKNRSHKSGVKL